jgi:hypothetical protein
MVVDVSGEHLRQEDVGRRRTADVIFWTLRESGEQNQRRGHERSGSHVTRGYGGLFRHCD